MARNQTVGQRVSQLIQALGMSKNAFALSLDKTATVIQHIVDERNKPGFDLLYKIFDVYPNVSKDWLIQGSGQMFNNAAQPEIAVPATPAAPVAPAPLPPAEVAPTTSNVEPIAPATTPKPAPSKQTAAEPAHATATVSASPATTEAEIPQVQAPAAVAPPAAPASAGWEAALFAQQLQHQLALAELRNQHLLEQQKMLQQMVELLRR